MMDYSLIQRTPDGTGKILVTTPGSPDKGSFVLEADMKIYTNQGMVAIADIVDDLVTADASKPLSANQGVVLKQLIDAFSGGIVPKGDILSSNLPPADASNKGWQYYCTDINQWATSDGTQWIMTSNNVITQTPDATDTGHALSNAVVTQCCNEVKGRLNQHESRLENLEQKAGDYGTWHYPNDPNHSSDMPNKVPTGKAKYGLVEKIVGKTRAWNQLVQNGNFADSSGWTAVYSTINGVSLNTISVKISADNANCRLSHDVEGWIVGHKYLLCATVKTPYTQPVLIGMGSRNSGYIDSGELTANDWNYVAGIAEATEANTGSPTFRIYPYKNTHVFQVGDDYSCKNACAYDLTLIFGPGNEPSTVADALAQLPALGQYNAYDAGSLVSTELSGVRSTSINIWDEEWEVGKLNGLTGVVDTSVTNAISSKNFIKVSPNTAYYLKLSSANMNLAWYDANYNFISGNNNAGSNTTRTSPNNAMYAKLGSGVGYGNTYKNDIQICLDSYADKTTYHPHILDTLSLSETVTLRSAGDVADTDELNVEVNGVARRRQIQRIGSVDMGTLNLSYTTNTQNVPIFYADISDFSGIANLLCALYVLVGQSRNAITNDREMSAWNSSYVARIAFSDSRYTDADLVNGKAPWLEGVVLNYELATPTTEAIDPIPDNFIEVEGGGTINTIQEQSPAIDNCLDVGYLTV